MGKKILDSKITYIVLAILCAVIFWVYVKVTEADNTTTKHVDNIPISFEGTEELQARGLMVIADDPTIDLTVEIRRTALLDFNRDTISLTVDVSGITEAGTYTMGYDIDWPSGYGSSSVTLQNRSAINVTFEVARYSERDVTVRGEFTGSLADGYLQGDFSFEPETVRISGQASLVDQVDYALVSFTGEDVSQTITGERLITLMGYDGLPLTDLEVECSDESVTASMQVLLTKEVPLQVEWLSGGGLTEADITWELSAPSITVAGDPSDIVTLEAITLGPIDLSTVVGSGEITLAVPLANELTNISGISEVTLRIEIGPSFTTKTVEATDIEVINPPAGYTADAVTSALSVMVRGEVEELESITPANVRVVADLSAVTPAVGQYSVPVRVYVDSAGNAGVVGSGYTIVINMRQI